MKPSVGLPPVHGSQAFDHGSYKYKCCCKSVHVKSGTHIIAVYSAISAVIGFLVGLGSGYSQVLMALLELLMVIALFYGLKKNDYRFLLPYTIYLLFAWILYTILLISLLLAPSSTIGKFLYQNLLPRIELGDVIPHLKGDEAQIRSIWIFATLFTICILSWFLSVFNKCIKYLKDLQENGQNEVPIGYVV